MAYLYRHIREDLNVPFYIGIGAGTTGKYKRAHNKTGRSDWWKRIVAKTDYRVEIIFEHDCYEFIKKKEIEFIKLYGRSCTKEGTLCNMTDGGDGCLGMTESHRQKVIKANKKRRMSDENKKKISEANKGRKMSTEHKEMLRKINTGKKISAEHKEKISIAAAKLTTDQVLEIRHLHKTTKKTQQELSVKYNVSRTAISKIVNRTNWKHI